MMRVKQATLVKDTSEQLQTCTVEEFILYALYCWTMHLSPTMAMAIRMLQFTHNLLMNIWLA